MVLASGAPETLKVKAGSAALLGSEAVVPSEYWLAPVTTSEPAGREPDPVVNPHPPLPNDFVGGIVGAVISEY